MKVEQVKEFTPITITLETEFEARVLQTLVSHIAYANKFRKLTDKLYEDLDRVDILPFSYKGTSFNATLVDLES